MSLSNMDVENKLNAILTTSPSKRLESQRSSPSPISASTRRRKNWFKWDQKKSESNKDSGGKKSFDFNASPNDKPGDDSYLNVLDQDWEHISCTDACRIKANKRERLSIRSIIINVIYNVALSITILLALSSLYLHDWVHTTEDQMKLAGIFVDPSISEFTSVACGLRTYCLDAPGHSECQIPKQTYGPNFVDSVIPLWATSAQIVIAATSLMVLPWLYTFAACFGCFNARVQVWMNKILLLGGIVMVGAIVTFACSFGDLAVQKCKLPHANATLTSNPPCTQWYATFPSDVLEGEGNAACRFCPPGVGPFIISDTCKFGYGAMFAVASVLMVFVASPLGKRVTSKSQDMHRKLSADVDKSPSKSGKNDTIISCGDIVSPTQVPLAEPSFTPSPKKLDDAPPKYGTAWRTPTKLIERQTETERDGDYDENVVDPRSPPKPSSAVKILGDGLIDPLEQSTI